MELESFNPVARRGERKRERERKKGREEVEEEEEAVILVSRRERNDITIVVRLEEREISLHVDRHMNSACRGCPVRARRTRRAIKIIHGGETWRDGRISCARLVREATK